MNSMTGYGRADLQNKDFRLQIELASVNSRYLETVFRMPRILAGFENKIKEAIAQNFSRGKIVVSVNIEIVPKAASLIDEEAAKAFFQQLKKIQKKLGIGGEIEIGQIASARELFSRPQDSIEESILWPQFKKALVSAIRDHKKMRAAEGRNLLQDMKKRCEVISKVVKDIDKQAAQNVKLHKTKLEKRIKELSEGIKLDPGRLAEEITIYVDRSDISEECTRLFSHIDLFSNTLTKKTVIGKRLTFILQEMGREANTIGSKALSTKTSAMAINIKEEIEKLREQAQNIE